MGALVVEIVSAEGGLFAGPASLVVVPAAAGELGILPGHAPLMARLRAGDVRVQGPEPGELVVFVTGGFVEVQPGRVTVLADLAYRGEQLEAAARTAREHAASLQEQQQQAPNAVSVEQALVEAAARYRLARRLGGRSQDP